MKNIEEMTVKELKELPLYPWQLETEAECVYFLKNGKTLTIILQIAS